MKKKKPMEIAVYLEGGIVQDVLIVNDKLPRKKWKPLPYTLIDFDIDGAGTDEICMGCKYSPDVHYNNCQKTEIK